jgi:hypothetical protein
VSNREKTDPKADSSGSPEHRRERPARKRYTRPALVEYGPIGKLTRAGSATIGDAGAMMMSCL